MTDIGTAIWGWEPCLKSHYCLFHNQIRLALGWSYGKCLGNVLMPRPGREREHKASLTLFSSPSHRILPFLLWRLRTCFILPLPGMFLRHWDGGLHHFCTTSNTLHGVGLNHVSGIVNRQQTLHPNSAGVRLKIPQFLLLIHPNLRRVIVNPVLAGSQIIIPPTWCLLVSLKELGKNQAMHHISHWGTKNGGQRCGCGENSAWTGWTLQWWLWGNPRLWSPWAGSSDERCNTHTQTHIPTFLDVFGKHIWGIVREVYSQTLAPTMRHSWILWQWKGLD